MNASDKAVAREIADTIDTLAFALRQILDGRHEDAERSLTVAGYGIDAAKGTLSAFLKAPFNEC